MCSAKISSLEMAAPSEKRGYAPTLAWYLGGLWLNSVVLTVLALAAFIYLMDVVDLWRQLAGKQVSTLTALSMSMAKVPDLIMRLLPFAVLLGSMMWLNQLNRRYELVALRAVGLPARRFLVGPLLACLMVGGLALAVGNPVAATMLKRYERWYDDVFPNATKGLVTAGGSIWLRQSGTAKDYFIYGQKVAEQGDSLGEATVFVFNKQGDFERRLDAQEARLEPGLWRLENVFSLTPNQAITHYRELLLPTTLTPAQIQASFNPPGTLNVWELRDFIKTLERSGFPTSRHAMAYQQLLALPVLCLAMMLLAVPFGLRYARNRSVGMVLLAGIGMGFGFYLFGNVMAAYGLSGRLDVRLAAWLPAVMAGLVAVALMLQLREE